MPEKAADTPDVNDLPFAGCKTIMKLLVPKDDNMVVDLHATIAALFKHSWGAVLGGHDRVFGEGRC
jgi:hypothetical protein